MNKFISQNLHMLYRVDKQGSVSVSRLQFQVNVAGDVWLVWGKS